MATGGLLASPGLGGAAGQQKKPGSKRCAEVCLELLCAESVRFFTEQQGGPAAAAALEAIGFRLGQQLAERYTRDKPRLGDTLDVIKFVCKDFWQALFKKQVDNLKTNHRGVYVLQDNGFRWLQRLAPAGPGSDPSKDEAVKRLAASYLHMPCGIIRGALSRLGLPCTVEADPKGLPSCTFTIKITA